MRKFLLLFFVCLCFITAGCCSNNGESPTDPIEPTLSTEVFEEPSEGDSLYNIYTNERAYAVMIDNDGNSSRPHAGLEDAYLIYEVYVEGKATRLMALFKGADTPKIGPVRSSRHYFLDYALDNDALYAHAGYSPKAMEELSTLGINNLNGLIYEPTYFWRERKYSGDYHSLYTSISNLSNLADKLGYRKTNSELPFKFSDSAPVYDGDSATDITIPYADFYYVSYKYDEATGLYDRYINSEYHPTQSGAKLKAGQIIFQFAKSYPLGDGSARIELDTIGSGRGIFISDGVKTPLTWKKSSRTGKLKFYTPDGKELILDDSVQTYVQVMPENLNYTIK